MMKDQLSKRERQVLLTIWDGMGTKETAEALGLSPCYVKNVAERLRLKLQASNRVEIVRRAVELGIIKVNSLGEKS